MEKTFEKSVDVNVPVSTAYNQWTQFESFPHFMKGVDEVSQLGPELTHWKTRIAGVEREFDAKIIEQHPDERVAWHAVDGVKHAGVVTFHRLNDSQTRVHLQMSFEPEGAAETIAAATGVAGGRIEGDMDRFKAFIEARGYETGGWRGDVDPPGQFPPTV